MSRFATRWLNRAGRPVKLLIDYTEELIAGNPRHGAVIKIKTGVKRNGLMIAEHIEFYFDSGAYGAYRPARLSGRRARYPWPLSRRPTA